MGAIAWALPDEGPIHGPVASELALRQAQSERVDASAPTATETTAGIDAVVESAGIDGVAESAGVAAGTEPADAPVGADPRVRPSADPHVHPSADPRVRPSTARVHPVIEWRVLVISLTLFMYSFGYGAITSFSAMFADALGVSPKSLYLTLLAVVILFTR